MCVVGTMASTKIFVQYWLLYTVTLWESIVYGLMLSLCCIGFKLVKFETDVEDLWVEGKLYCKFYAFIFHLITCNEKIHSQIIA